MTSHLPETSPLLARRTAPAITVQTIANELHELYPQQLPTPEIAAKLVAQSLANFGYSNLEPGDAVWSSNREHILRTFERHYRDG